MIHVLFSFVEETEEIRCHVVFLLWTLAEATGLLLTTNTALKTLFVDEHFSEDLAHLGL